MPHAPQEDLFGNTVDDQTPQEPAAPREPVNDIDLTQQVLADIVGGDAAPLHLEKTGVRRCAGRDTEPVPDDVAAVVDQLLTARYLTTGRPSCTGHGPAITATRAGRNAAHRWSAYRRPSTWDRRTGEEIA